ANKWYRGTSELVEDTEDESLDLYIKGEGSEKEGLGSKDEGPGLEEEGASPEGQQQAVLVVDTVADKPLGLGYRALRLSPLSLAIPTLVASPTTTLATIISVDEDEFLEVGVPLELYGSILHNHTQCLDVLPPALFEVYDRDLRKLYTRSREVKDEIFSQRYRLRNLDQEQERATVTFGAIWRPVLALESWTGHVVVGYRCALCRGYLVQLLSSFEIICGIGRTCMWIICGIMRSNLLARDPLPDVKDAFAIVSREQSDKGPAPGKHVVKGSPAAFVVRTNNNNNDNSNRIVNTNDVLILIQFAVIMHMTVSIKNMFNVVDISSLMFTMGHPNGTWAKITTIGSLRRSGSEPSGLHMFDCIDNYEFNVGVYNSIIVCYVSKELWHCRLGHLANQVLFVLGDKIRFKTSDHVPTCDICHKAKLTREHFPLSDHKSIGLDDLIHLNV
nr:hypothetical protein [Tanacetum cinerariifolium]